MLDKLVLDSLKNKQNFTMDKSLCEAQVKKKMLSNFKEGLWFSDVELFVSLFVTEIIIHLN